MDLELLNNVTKNIEDEMFSDSATKEMYDENIKQRLIYKHGVVEYQGRQLYVPDYCSNQKPTVGMGIHDDIYGDISDNIIIAENSQHVSSIYDDAYSITSQGVPTFLTTIWTNKFFTAITRKTVFNQVSHPFQQGAWGITSNIKIPTISFAGNFSLYNDFGMQGNSSINLNWIDRQTVTFERPIIYGDMAVARMSVTKIDYMARLREGVANQIKLHADAIGFFGYSANMRIYGLLNDPSLNPTINAIAKAGAGSSVPNTLWQYATYFEMIADIINLRQEITSRAGGQDDDNALCYLLLPPSVWERLGTPNPLGTSTVREWINHQYPNMQIIKAPLLQGTGTPIGSVTPNLCALIFDKLDGQECLQEAFITLYQSHGVKRENSGYSEKISYALGGAIITNAIGIQIMQGI